MNFSNISINSIKQSSIANRRIFIFLQMCFIVFQMLSCGKQYPKNEEELSIEFEKTVHDFKTIKMNSINNAQFKFLNKSNLPVKIEKIITSCSCTSAEWDKNEVISNKFGLIKVKYKPNYIGPFVNIIDVYFKDSNSPQKILIKGIVKDN